MDREADQFLLQRHAVLRGLAGRLAQPYIDVPVERIPVLVEREGEDIRNPIMVQVPAIQLPDGIILQKGDGEFPVLYPFLLQDQGHPLPKLLGREEASIRPIQVECPPCRGSLTHPRAPGLPSPQSLGWKLPLSHQRREGYRLALPPPWTPVGQPAESRPDR